MCVKASLIDNDTLGFSTPATSNDFADYSTTKAPTPETGIENATTMASPQTDHVVVSEHSHPNIAIIATSAETKGSVSVDNNSREILISISRIVEMEHEVHVSAQEESAVESSPSSQFNSGDKLVKSPTVHSSPSPQEECVGGERPLEEDVQQSIPALEALREGQEEALKRETVAHQQTRAELDRLILWCDHLTDENEKFQTVIANAEREHARLQRELQSVGDVNVGLQVSLDQAKERNKGLTNSYLSSTLGMQAESTNLKAENVWYKQAGAYFRYRVLEVGKSLYHPEKLTAEYQKLMREAANYTSRSTTAAAYPNQFGEEALIEIEGKDENESNDGTVSDDEDHDTEEADEEDEEKRSDERYIDLEDYESDEHDTSSDEEETPRMNRPMKPLRAKRVPLSTSIAITNDMSVKPSSSALSKRTEEAQQAPSPVSSTFSTNPSSGRPSTPTQAYKESETSEEQEQAQEPGHEPAQKRMHSTDFSNTSTHDRHERCGVQRVQGRPIRGTNVAKRPLRHNQRTTVGKNVRGGMSGDVDVSPSATAFSFDFGFAGPSTRDGSGPEEIVPLDRSIGGTNTDASSSAAPFKFKFGSSRLSTGKGNGPEETAVPVFGAHVSEKSTNSILDFKVKSDTKAAPMVNPCTVASLMPKSHTGEALVEVSETNDDRGRDAVKRSWAEGEAGPTDQQPLTAASCDTDQQPRGCRKSEDRKAAAEPTAEKADTEPTSTYAIKDSELMQSLMNGIARLSIGPPMLPMSPARWRSQGRLSSDWNISGIWNYSADHLDRRPNLGRFADYTAAQWGNGCVMRPLDWGREALHPTLQVSKSATGDREISVVGEGEEESEGTGKTAGAENIRAQEQRDDNSTLVGGGRKMKDGDSSKADLSQPERVTASPNLTSSSSTQAEEVYQSPFCLKGAFGVEKRTPKEKYISPFSMRKRKT